MRSMNISKNPKTLKTADGFIPKEGDTLYYLWNWFNGAKIKKFACKHWHSGGMVNYHALSKPLDPPYWVNLAGYPKGFYPPNEDSPYAIIYYKDVFYEYKNAIKAYKNRIKRMSKIKFPLDPKDCQEKKKTHEY